GLVDDRPGWLGDRSRFLVVDGGRRDRGTLTANREHRTDVLDTVYDSGDDRANAIEGIRGDRGQDLGKLFEHRPAAESDCRRSSLSWSAGSKERRRRKTLRRSRIRFSQIGWS